MNKTIIVTVSLKLKDDMLRVITETENCHRDQGIDFDDGYPEAADEVLKEVLGEMSKIAWQAHLEKLVQEQPVEGQDDSSLEDADNK